MFFIHAHEVFTGTWRKTIKISIMGAGGVSKTFCKPKSYFFVTFSSMHNFTPIAYTILGESNHKNSGHFIPQPHKWAEHADHSDQFHFIHKDQKLNIDSLFYLLEYLF